MSDKRLYQKPRHPGRELLDDVIDERFPYSPIDLIHEVSRAKRLARADASLPGGGENLPEYMRDDEVTIRRRRRVLNEALGLDPVADRPIHHRTA